MDRVLALLRQAPDVVAPQLLGATLQCRAPDGTVVVRITEVEAYGGIGQDAASHAHRGRTPRNVPMFDDAATIYVYRSYGIHLCLNLVTGEVGEAGAVLIRAGQVLEGVDLARRRRNLGTDKPDEYLARGPGNLGQALGITLQHSGSRVTETGTIALDMADRRAPSIACGPRVGVSQEAQRPWRWWVDNDPTVSLYRPSMSPRSR